MIVFDVHLLLEKVALVAELLRRLRHQIDQPRGGMRLALDVEILVADHVGEHKGFDLVERAVTAPFCGQMAAAVSRIGVRPCWMASSPSKKTSHTE